MKILQEFNNLLKERKAIAFIKSTSDSELNIAVKPRENVTEFISAIETALAECEIGESKIVSAEESDYGYKVTINVECIIDHEKQTETYTLIFTHLY